VLALPLGHVTTPTFSDPRSRLRLYSQSRPSLDPLELSIRMLPNKILHSFLPQRIQRSLSLFARAFTIPVHGIDATLFNTICSFTRPRAMQDCYTVRLALFRWADTICGNKPQAGLCSAPPQPQPDEAATRHLGKAGANPSWSLTLTTKCSPTVEQSIMAVPFGFSVGDIAMALKFTVQVASALKETGGAASDYREVLQYLEGLLLTLQHLQKLDTRCVDPSLANAVRALTTAAERPIRDFVNEMGKYTNAMASPSSLASGVRKAEWAIVAAKKAEKLRLKIVAQMEPIHLLLASQNL